jgi:hypothetical protein
MAWVTKKERSSEKTQKRETHLETDTEADASAVQSYSAQKGQRDIQSPKGESRCE